MNNLINTNPESVTMTSLELVEFINSQRGEGESALAHADFMKKVPKVLGETGAGNFSDTYRHQQNGQIYPCYRFPKREACLMAMSYSYDLQAKVFDKMTALETKSTIDPMKALSDPAIMRGLLLTYTEKVITLENKVHEQEPKVQAFNRIASAEGMLNLQTAGKVLQQPPNKFIQKLRELRWIFKRPGAKYNSAHVDKINAGYLATKAREYVKEDGTTHVADQVMVTPKGLAKLALILGVIFDENENNGGTLI